MTEADQIIFIGIVVVALIYLFYRIGTRSERKDRPGPHNNWRSDTSTSNSSGWRENFPGNVSDGSSDGGGH